MTDYTPENRIQEQVDRLHDRSTAAEESLKFTDRKFAELVREATRLKEERDELLEMLKAAMKAAYSFRPGFSEMKALELIERIDRD